MGVPLRRCHWSLLLLPRPFLAVVPALCAGPRDLAVDLRPRGGQQILSQAVLPAGLDLGDDRGQGWSAQRH